MNVREATPADAEAVRAVHRASIEGLGPAAYDDEQVAAWAQGCESADYTASIESVDTYFVVAEDDELVASGDEGEVATSEGDGDVVAFGTLRLAPPEGYEADADAEVTGVYVHPSAAGRGVGSAVLAALERRACAEEVETLGLTASLNAVGFYEARGYERVRAYDHEFSAHESTGVEGRVVEVAKAL